MRNIAFTICAKNYIGLAQVLEKSIKNNNPEIEFYIFVADEFEEEQLLPNNVLIAREVLDISDDEWNQMTFKYDLTEFCTSIKPTCFKYVFEECKPDKCIYFDPDIFVFSSLDNIYEQLNNYSIILTPHITTLEINYSGSLNERNLLYSGMFNLGFIALKADENSAKMLNWWEVRLKDRCFQNMMENYFTDQKWMDFLPSFFPNKLLISSDLGLNLAPWNFHEREISVVDNCIFVSNRIELNIQKKYKLVFVHFSGISYKALLDEDIKHHNLNSLVFFEDLLCLFKLYRIALSKSDFLSFINYQYSYNYFSNSRRVSAIHRKLFRRLYEDGKNLGNPFNSNEFFYEKLKNNGLIGDKLVDSDKSSINNITSVESKTITINRVLNLLYKIIGSERYFLLTRLMRLYSITENHVFLIDKEYFKRFKIKN